MDREDSVKKALEKYLGKQDPKKKRLQKNKKPEKELEKLVMSWLASRNFACHVVESKAVYNARANRYLSGQAVKGFPDIVGCDSHGYFVAIELKAPGRRSTLREDQRLYLESALARGSFAVCVDRVDALEFLYENWIVGRRSCVNSASKFLLDHLPKKKQHRHQHDEDNPLDDFLNQES